MFVGCTPGYIENEGKDAVGPDSDGGRVFLTVHVQREGFPFEEFQFIL